MIKIEVFKQIRKEKGSQAALAAKAKVSQQLIGEIESGRTRSTKAIYRIAEALGTSAHVLDPDIPSLEGRAAKLIADLRDISDEEASSILDNAERMVELIRTRITEALPQSGDPKPDDRPKDRRPDIVIVEAKTGRKSRDSGAEEPFNLDEVTHVVLRSYARFDTKLSGKLSKLLEQDTDFADELNTWVTKRMLERQSDPPRGGTGGVGRMQKP